MYYMNKTTEHNTAENHYQGAAPNIKNQFVHLPVGSLAVNFVGN